MRVWGPPRVSIYSVADWQAGCWNIYGGGNCPLTYSGVTSHLSLRAADPFARLSAPWFFRLTFRDT